IAPRIPDDAEARPEVPRIAAGDRIARHPFVTGEDEPRRSGAADPTLESRIEARAIEMRDLARPAVRWKVGIPSKADVQRHVRRHGPAVLDVHADVVGAHLSPR